jgi:hypothetical protein
MIKTPAQASLNYGTNGGSINAANLWGTNLSSQLDSALTKAAAAVAFWASQVSTQQAQTNFVSGLNKAKTNEPAIISKINGPGKLSFTAGVKAASTGAYASFAAAWLPAVSGEVQQLNISNPRGTLAQNRARQAAYDQWVDSQAGKFRVK